MDFNTGDVEATETFDTQEDGGAAKAMSNFLRSLYPGKVILCSTKENAGLNMIEEAYDLLVS